MDIREAVRAEAIKYLDFETFSQYVSEYYDIDLKEEDIRNTAELLDFIVNVREEYYIIEETCWENRQILQPAIKSNESRLKDSDKTLASVLAAEWHYHSLSDLLEVHWKIFAKEFGVTEQLVTDLETHNYSQPRFWSVLYDWVQRTHPTVKRFLQIVEKIPGNEEASYQVMEWTFISYLITPDTEKTRNKLEFALDKKGPWKWLKLFLVGDAGAGKSSVLRWLVGKTFDPTPSNTDSANVADVRNWTEHLSTDTAELLADCITGIRKQTIIAPPFHHIAIDATKEVENREKPIRRNYSFVGNAVLSNVNKHQQRLMNHELPLTFQVWDLGGQEVYHNTHHFFFSATAIYLLIVDINRPVQQIEESTKFWLRSIRSYAQDAPIVVIATHLDLVTKEDYNQKMMAIWRPFESLDKTAETGRCFAVSCKSPENLSETRDFLKSLAKEVTKEFDLVYPVGWMLLYHLLQLKIREMVEEDYSAESPLKYLTLEDVQSEGKECGLEGQNLVNALEEFHKLGFVLYFSKDGILSQTVFMDPQCVVDALRTVITVQKPQQVAQTADLRDIFSPGAKKKNQLNQLFDNDEEDLKKGILTATRMNRIWAMYLPEERILLRALLQRFELAVPYPAPEQSEENCDFLVPCLVETDAQEDKKLFPKLFTYNISGAPPLGLLSRAIVKALSLARKQGTRSLCKLFKKGCTFILDEGTHVRMDVGLDTVEFRMQTMARDKIISFLLQMDKFFEAQVKKFDKWVQCTECKEVFKTYEWELLCFDCAYKLACRMKPNKAKLADLLTNPHRRNRLSEVLDSGLLWKHFGDHKFVATPVNFLDRLEVTWTMQPRFSPTKEILETWLPEPQATVTNFIEIMRSINCSTAIQLVMDFANQDQLDFVEYH